MAFMTFHSVGNVIIPTDELIFFRGVETTNQRLYYRGFIGRSRGSYEKTTW
jgi:hypothetical protein